MTKYGRESSDFFVKSSEKSASYGLLWLIIYRSFDRNDVFLTNFGHENRVFHEKVKKKMIWEHKSKVNRTVKLIRNTLIMERNWEKIGYTPYVKHNRLSENFF